MTVQNPRALPTVRRFAPHYSLFRAILRVSANVSEGLALGYTHGFDSGLMLDYVYRNRSTAYTVIGRWIDWVFLNQIGWRAARARKTMLQNTVRAVLSARRERGVAAEQIHILDLAAGTGSYLLELLADNRAANWYLTCKDIDCAGFASGHRKAMELGLADRVRFEYGDATDPLQVTQVDPDPQIVVVAGLYETLTDDAAVCRSLRSIRTILSPGATLVFTTQIRQPQLELIANVLTNRYGTPWVMGVRSLGRVERWAREAGFRAVTSELEPHGLFAITRCVG